MRGRDRRWNHNIHYYPLVLAAVPSGCQRALDVGCREDRLARQLACRVPQVVGIDQDATSIERLPCPSVPAWIPGGLATVHIDRDRDTGQYWEPNVWLIHQADPGRGPGSDQTDPDQARPDQ